jgi:hypothetical protein
MKTHGGRTAPHTFLTLALEKGECSTPHPDCCTPGKQPLASTEQDAGWAPDQVWAL